MRQAPGSAHQKTRRRAVQTAARCRAATANRRNTGRQASQMRANGGARSGGLGRTGRQINHAAYVAVMKVVGELVPCGCDGSHSESHRGESVIRHDAAQPSPLSRTEPIASRGRTSAAACSRAAAVAWNPSSRPADWQDASQHDRQNHRSASSFAYAVVPTPVRHPASEVACDVGGKKSCRARYRRVDVAAGDAEQTGRLGFMLTTSKAPVPQLAESAPPQEPHEDRTPRATTPSAPRSRPAPQR